MILAAALVGLGSLLLPVPQSVRIAEVEQPKASKPRRKVEKRRPEPVKAKRAAKPAPKPVPKPFPRQDTVRSRTMIR